VQCEALHFSSSGTLSAKCGRLAYGVPLEKCNLRGSGFYMRLMGGYAPDGCLHDGAIAWLGLKGHDGFNVVRSAIASQHYIAVYSIVTALSLACYWPIRVRVKSIFARSPNLILLATALLGTVAFCFVAIDWGRFIEINLVAIYTISFLGLTDTKARQNYVRAPRWAVAALLVFNQLWHIPHAGLSFFLGYTISRKILHLF